MKTTALLLIALLAGTAACSDPLDTRVPQDEEPEPKQDEDDDSVGFHFEFPPPNLA